MLFIKQCNKLHDILPELFEKTDDYSELLLTISFTDPEGIIHHLINDIEDVDFRINDEMYTDDRKIKADGQVEIIGWLYQYYISKKHEEVIDIGLKEIHKVSWLKNWNSLLHLKMEKYSMLMKKSARQM